MGHTHRYQFDFKKKKEKKNQVKSPSIWSRVPETGSDLPIGSDQDSGCDTWHLSKHGGTQSKELGIANMLNPSQDTNPNCLFI